MWSYNYTQQNDELYHYGVQGMKWGVRRYQNADGSLTEKGRKKYGVDNIEEYKYLKERGGYRYDTSVGARQAMLDSYRLQKQTARNHKEYKLMSKEKKEAFDKAQADMKKRDTEQERARSEYSERLKKAGLTNEQSYNNLYNTKHGKKIVDDYVKTTAKNNGMTMKEVRNMVPEDRELLEKLVDDHLKRIESSNK